ncbi:MAG: AAA family ATPase, partial [Chitinispirillales bacterium]|nr:AAA family ATPase [Chitinispirillales bacterium]
MAVKERISKLLEALNVGLYERENELKLALLSSIAGESIFFLGLPGVAKSLVAKRLKYAYKGERVFEYLMSRFSTPDEIFGPISISELKKDKYVRVIDGYLPDAEVVFLDEIWKAGPSIQNTLLTILNEKVFRNGKTESEIRDEKNVKIERDVPIKVLISASNELPNEDDKALGQSLDALWDRFLVRFVVDGIEDPEKFNKMIAMSDAPYKDTVADKITDDDYQKWKDAIGKIVIPENVFKVIGAIKEKVRLHNDNVNKENAERQIYISDRRWHKIVRLLRASAFLNDRAEVDLMDCFLIRHCIWNEKEQRNQVWQFVNEAIEEQGCAVSLDLGEIKAGIDKLKKEIE